MAASAEGLVILIEPVVRAMDLQLWGIEWVRGHRARTLRIYIDSDSGVTVNDCEKISRQVSALLDVEEPVSGEYTLEVSSPGLDRPLYTLDQYRRFIGEKLDVRLRHSYEGKRRFKGQLVGVEDSDIVLLVDDQEYLFPVEGVEKANLVPSI